MSGYYKIDYKLDGQTAAIIPPDKLREFLRGDIEPFVEALAQKIEHDRANNLRAFE